MDILSLVLMKSENFARHNLLNSSMIIYMRNRRFSHLFKMMVSVVVLSVFLPPAIGQSVASDVECCDDECETNCDCDLCQCQVSVLAAVCTDPVSAMPPVCWFDSAAANQYEQSWFPDIEHPPQIAS
jgi:hypothetical protein